MSERADDTTVAAADVAKRYRRPLILSIGVSALGELVIFVVFGVVLYPDGDLLTKFLWTVVFCGIGMGSAVGAVIALFIVGRVDGQQAVLATVGVSVVLLGLACDLLCLTLDQHFQFFGGHELPVLFSVNGVAMSAIGGALVGWLLFMPRGRALVDRVGL